MSPARRGSKATADGAPEHPFADGIPAVVALAGDEELTKDRWFAELIAAAGKSASVIEWSDPTDSAGKELQRLLSDLRSRPLFGGCKVIVVRDGDALVKRHGNDLAAACEITNGNHLVLRMRTIDGRTELAKKLGAIGGLLRCQRPEANPGEIEGGLPDDSPLVATALAEAARRGITIDRAAVRELLGRTGNDLLLVSVEIDKLSLAFADRAAPLRIEADDVRALVPRSAAYDQFQLVQAVLNGRAGEAVTRIRGVLRHGTLDRRGKRVTDPSAISLSLIALLTARISLLLRYRAASARGLAGPELQQELGVKNPGQLWFLAKETGLPILKSGADAVRALTDADRDLKSGRPAEHVLESMVLRLCRAQSARGAARPPAVELRGRP